MPELTEYLEFATELAREAGVIARRHFTADVAYEVKSDNSPVTIADTEINQLIIDRCQQRYPEIGVLGEELSSELKPGKLLWVCDPIDGTIPYTLGMPISTFCLALVDDGVPVVGVVYDFNNERLFCAVKGQDAWLNGKVLLPPQTEPMRLVSLEWWHSAKYDLSGAREDLSNQGYQVPNYASGAFTSMMIGLGRISGIIYAGDKPWDGAAAKVIVEELGATMTSLSGTDQRYDKPIEGYILAAPGAYTDLLSAVQPRLDSQKFT